MHRSKNFLENFRIIDKKSLQFLQLAKISKFFCTLVESKKISQINKNLSNNVRISMKIVTRFSCTFNN